MFPADDYTPHGYLDTPTHTWALNPVGVLRSLAPIGMGWHVPNYGSYGRNQFRFSAHLLVGLRVGKQVLLTPEDFASQGITLSSDYHSKNILRIVFGIDNISLGFQAAFFWMDERALGCLCTLEHGGAAPLEAECLLAARYVYNPATTRRWVQGLMSWQKRPKWPACIGVYPEEDHALALHASLPSAGYHAAATLTELRAWLAGEPQTAGQIPEPPPAGAPDGCWVRWVGLRYPLTLQPGSSDSLTGILAGGVSTEGAQEHARLALKRSREAIALREVDDDVFWREAARLEGDWPAHWRRGWVYDLETLRMVARPPAGVFRRAWDGMQIQAPRLVLAEAALDALALSYADPALAKELLLSAFQSARLPNVPCMREDGSYNMLTDAGEPCGTAPEWGFPLFCCDLLYKRLGNLTWLRALYPGAATYLRWWLQERRDADGWLVYVCSYESGQDNSPRFGPGDTGASSTRHIRPVDLQASVAQAARILGEWADKLKLADEAAGWHALAQDYTARAQMMWQPAGWFHDFDLRAGAWSPVRDAMQLAPLFCGCATQEQTAALALLFQPESALPLHGERWHPLVWPPVAFTVIEAAAAAGHYEAAARLTMQTLEHAYQRSDSRTIGTNGGLPGIAREYWPDGGEARDAGPGGIEGYGWGALGIALLIRHIIGLREVAPGRFTLTPAIPAALARAGTRLSVGPISLARGWLRIEIQPEEEDSMCTLVVTAGRTDDAQGSRAIPATTLEDEAGAPVPLTEMPPSRAGERAWRARARMFAPLLLSV